MEKKMLRKLTDEEKQKIIFVVKDVIPEEVSEEPTEYDVLMNQKTEEFISILLKDNDPERNDNLLKICEEYIREDGKSFSVFGLIMKYDMWLNESQVWPVMYNPKWEEWNKLKKKKVDKKEKFIV